MKKENLILPISVIIGCFILGGFFYLSQINKQKDVQKENESKINEDFSKKMECEKYKEGILENIQKYNISQKPEIRDSNNSNDNNEPVNNTYIDKKELKEIFYSPKINSCLYIEDLKTSMKYNANETWGVVYEYYNIIDVFTDKKLESIKIINRGEVINFDMDIEKIMNKYKSL